MNIELRELGRALRCDAEWLEGRCHGRACQGCAYGSAAGEQFSTPALERLAAGALERLLDPGGHRQTQPLSQIKAGKEPVSEQVTKRQKPGPAGRGHCRIF